MLISSEEIYEKARRTVRRCGTRDPMRIAEGLGIRVRHVDGFDRLLGMYAYICKERHILLNSRMDGAVAQMVCAHEIGHDALHRDLAKESRALPEFVLFDMKTRREYEANAFAAHVLIDEGEMEERLGDGCGAEELAAALHVDGRLLMVKLGEMNRMGAHYDLPFVPSADFLKDVAPSESGLNA